MHNVSLSLDYAQLAQEYLLVAAWKKSHDHIRRHNWYSDVLELDLTNASIGKVLEALSQEVSGTEGLKPDPLRLVLAPKSQSWDIKNDKWIPKDDVNKKLRPLAHLSVRDQIIGTAFMILFADTIESLQGDPRMTASDANTNGMVSYGHRLFCDYEREQVRYRWGNANVYRQYFQDYQQFIKRPEQIIAERFDTDDSWAVVSADLSQYYDRVRPELLHDKIAGIFADHVDGRLIDAFRAFFSWQWHADDIAATAKYAKNSDPQIVGFDRVALPQGLVASGFFANAVLLDFDQSIVEMFGVPQVDDAFSITDYCRYVDDMRFVVRLSDRIKSLSRPEQENFLRTEFTKLLEHSLSTHATGLLVKPEKTGVLLGVNAGGSKRFANAMQRINENTSGVMDVFLGGETLDLVEGLFYSTGSTRLNPGNRFQGTVLDLEPDVREQTVSRFAANRFRMIFRTLRPMCTSKNQERRLEDSAEDKGWHGAATGTWELTQKQLDEKAEHFSALMIERWVRDPSNMRLLRIAMDLNPSVDNGSLVIDDLLKNHFNRRKSAPRMVAVYCLAELLKAGATETGLVDDSQKLPETASLQRYQERLRDLAMEIVKSRKTLPWYLLQQAHLFLACFDKSETVEYPANQDQEIQRYILLRQVTGNNYANVPELELASFACIHSRLKSPERAAASFLERFREIASPQQRPLLLQILEEQRQLAIEIWKSFTNAESDQWRSLFDEFGVLASIDGSQDENQLASDVVVPMLEVACNKNNPFRQEVALLWFAKKLISELHDRNDSIGPNGVFIHTEDWSRLLPENFPIGADAFRVDVRLGAPEDRRFWVPRWVPDSQQWAYSLGMLLRVLLTGNPDYTQNSHAKPKQSKIKYRPYRSSWLRRRYGLFNGRAAFGPPWIPVSTWLGDLLTVLLRWPGFPSRVRSNLPLEFTPKKLTALIETRIKSLDRLYGQASHTSVLPILVPKKASLETVPLFLRTDLMKMRVAVAQTVLPRKDDFTSDRALSDPAYRMRHRRHSAAVLTAIDRMLQVRTTHSESIDGIELLVLPELSIHPDDINSLIYPFVRRNRCMVCTGLVFHPIEPGDNRVINVAGWFIPVQTPTGGLDIERVYQGKRNLTDSEVKLGVTPFRPSQWIFRVFQPGRYRDSLWSMSSAVCYDATDLKLAADLRDKTDMFVVPALNQDVGTFDNMAAALHYHMFQHVVVANSGEFGGSSAHAPFKHAYNRTIFHSHGNEQVAIGFFELDFDLYRTKGSDLKTPPADFDRESGLTE
ncbi:RNA-directed DNA polymerase [Roseiconus lacunae]|uniref:RNA-directed DNA polymerase n=1 Tax=Roseiconus lacunae TaxID=2605694 RepID=UPI001E61FB36|nr:RNA-directed DNA polymerase [Roseiconus lacunae]MCD0458649.1 RNA-directed DNA polymerase [Roseiconus lacunae]